MAALAPEQIVDLYRHLSDVMGRMVTAAQERDWERLRALETELQPITQTLMREESAAAWPEELKRAKFTLLRKLLDDDAAIRTITQPWMDELQALMGRTRNRQLLSRAYTTGLN